MKHSVFLDLLFFAGLLTCVVLIPDSAFAQEADGVFCTVSSWFTSGVGKAIGTIMVTALGIQALTGRISWGVALLLGAGIAGMFGAVSIVSALTGISSGQICSGYAV